MNEPEIVKALERVGCSVLPVDDLPFDLIVGRHGINYLIELKTRQGRMRQSQLNMMATWRGQWAMARTVDEALAVVGVKPD